MASRAGRLLLLLICVFACVFVSRAEPTGQIDTPFWGADLPNKPYIRWDPDLPKGRELLREDICWPVIMYLWMNVKSKRYHFLNMAHTCDTLN